MIPWSRFKKLKNLPNNIVASFKMLPDPRISLQQKLVFVGLALGYAIWPWDFVLDVPFVGQIDDLAVFLAVYAWFMSRVPLAIRKEYGWKGDK